MIDVEQDALRALEQDTLAGLLGLVERHPHRLGIGEHDVGNLAKVAEQALAVDRRFAEAGAERIVVRAQPLDLRPQRVEMGEVAHADRAAADLVLVSRADAAARGADLAGARRVLAQTVEVTVEGQDQRAGLGDLEIVRRDGDALATQLGDLVAQMPRIEHHAIADHRQRAAHDP